MSNLCRWFMREHQFTTDTYRLFSSVSLLPFMDLPEAYSQGSAQKFILRQVKSMDHFLKHPPDPDDPASSRPGQWQESMHLSARDLTTGNVVVPQEMDPILLVLYAHQLYANRTFTGALSYLWRAHAAFTEGGQEGDPLLYLTLGLSYIGYSLKRQAGNRHVLISHGLAFMFKYHDMRTGKDGARAVRAEERMEAEYNMGRVYHTIGG